MNIKTKFEVSDVVEHKYATDFEGATTLYDIKEITTQSCYALTQVFYSCKIINVVKVHKNKYDKDSPIEFKVVLSHAKHEGEMGWIKLREDDLKPVSKEMKEILNK